MRPKHLLLIVFSFILWMMFYSCTAPLKNDQSADVVVNAMFSDSLVRMIHDLKNNRNTAELKLFLVHSNPMYRAEAAMAFGSVQDSIVIPELSVCLTDEDPQVRMMAAFALGQLRSPIVSESLVQLIKNDTTTLVITEALEALGKSGGKAASAFLLSYRPRFLFDEAGKAWGIYHLGLNQDATAEHAAEMLFMLDSEFLDSRLASAHFFSRYVVQHSLEGLEQLVNAALNDPSAEVRMAATKALGNQSVKGRSEALKQLLVDEDSGVRTNAILALQKAKIADAQEEVYKALDDGNSNVAITAANYFKSLASIGDLKKLKQKALVHSSPQVQAAIYSAIIKHEANKKELSSLVKELMSNSASAYHQVAYLRALEPDKAAQSSLDSIVFSANLITSTPALEILHNQMLEFGCTNDFKMNLMNRLLKQGDTGLLAYSALMLKDPRLDFKSIFNDFEKIESQMSKLVLPQELEAWIELNSALSYLSNTEPKQIPAQKYYQINWSLLQQFSSEPEVKVHTKYGSFDLVLLMRDAPATVSYFLELLQSSYYNQKAFHRVVPNFVVQAGCPRGDGYGSTAPLLRSEFSPIHYGAGVAGIASAGKDTESCQWFVTHSPTPHLDGRYTIFAAATNGMNVIHQISVGDQIELIELNTVN